MSSNLIKYCNNVIPRENIDIFKDPARVIITGVSNGGKTAICVNLIKKYKQKFESIIIANSPNYNEFENIEEIQHKLHIINYIPSLAEINENYGSGAKIIILDDNFYESLNDKNVLSYFIHGRHSQLSVLLVTHNIFYSKGKYTREITLNASHIILMKLRDLNQISILANQIFGKSNKVLETYKYIQSKYRFGHLLIDLSINSSKQTELRSHIVPSNESNFETVYM